MYHSITIGDKNTWSDWHLIPASRPVVNPPSVKTSAIEIPGADGILDLTEALTGRPMYGNRTGSWTFFVDHEKNTSSWATVYSNIMEYLHGKELVAVLEDDPTFSYEGRFSVNQWASNPTYSSIVINYNVGPYKKYSIINGDDWLWDPFNFENDTIKSYRNLVVPKDNQGLIISIQGYALPSIPLIVASTTGITLEYNNITYSLKRGNNTISDVVIPEGLSTMQFRYSGSGKATVTIKLTGGIL